MENLIEFLDKVGKLKELKRKGWLLRGIKNPESVAEHTFRAAIMAFVLAKKEKLNAEKCIKLILVHDLCEAITGDITPSDNLRKSEKHRMEKKAMQLLSEKSGSKELLKLWLEYEKRKTKEAKFAYDIDKLEMLLQAFEYEKKHKVNLQEFYDSAERVLQTKIAREIVQAIKKGRHKFK